MNRTAVWLSDDERAGQWWEGFAGQQFKANDESRAFLANGWRQTPAFNPMEWRTHPLNRRGYYGSWTKRCAAWLARPW